jgi:heme-degrading monooxygenase HmoA
VALEEGLPLTVAGAATDSDQTRDPHHIPLFSGLTPLEHLHHASILIAGGGTESIICKTKQAGPGKLSVFAKKRSAPVILEVAILNVRPGQEDAFEAAMRVARPLIAATPGFEDIEVRRCIEQPSRYLLLVNWQTLESHTVGFRQSDRYQEWRKCLHHFYDPFPVVEHYQDGVAFTR